MTILLSVPHALTALPPTPLLAGPILRRLQPRDLALWLVTEAPCELQLRLHRPDGRPLAAQTTARALRAGERLWIHWVQVKAEVDFQPGEWTGYRVWLAPAHTPPPSDDAAPPHPWCDSTVPELCHAGRDSPGFIFQPQVRALLHGSCRKPHSRHPGDGLARADAHLQRVLAARAAKVAKAVEVAKAANAGAGPEEPAGPDRPASRADGAHAAPPAHEEAWPSALVMSGDQVYCDDVAGPMLLAIHALARRLGLPDEALPGAEAAGIRSARDLMAHPQGLYGRDTLLPRSQGNAALLDLFFAGVRKPVFTTANAHNHLVTLAEVLCMYLLAWAPEPWKGLDLSPPPGLDQRHLERWAREQRAIEAFREGLPAVRRLMAHLPVAMVFDDHDVTDDWNLSREWEEAAYGHAFSRRIIGNALVGYLLNQAWGNRPEAFDDGLFDSVQQALDAPGGEAHDALVERLLRWREWHYTWPTEPPLMVLDSRTHRWRSEGSPRRPSGLLDWEGLTDLQQALRGHPAVLLVASAPVFGVKLIETLQRVATYLGRPLMVDAENWMSHPGAASTVLNIFRHPQTPQTFVILSGDVHYSFVYDVELRPQARRGLRGDAPRIWQLCSSGLRNQFPGRLLAVLDHLNRWLYSPRSPLNLFTRRRSMRVVPRKPEGTPHGRRLLVGHGIGLVELDAKGQPWRMRQLMCDGRDIAFVPREGEAREE